MQAEAQVYFFNNRDKAPSESLPTCQVSYRAGINGNLFLMPSGRRGFTEIGDLSAQVLTACQPNKESGFILTVEGELNSSSATINPALPIKLQQLNFGNSNSLGGFQVGLLWDPWIHRSHRMWGYHLLQPDFRDMVTRVNLVPAQEMGFQAVNTQGWSQFGIRASNGESWPNPEEGPNKDVTLWWEAGNNLDSAFSLMLYGRVGRFDFVNRDSNQKTRAGVQISYQSLRSPDPNSSRGFRTQVQMMTHESGVDGLIYQQTAPRQGPPFGEGIDLIPLGGQKIKGSVTDWWMGYEFPETRADLFLKLSHSQIELSSSLYGARSAQAGLSIAMQMGSRITFFMTQTEFQEGFILGTNDRQSLGVNFEFLSY